MGEGVDGPMGVLPDVGKEDSLSIHVNIAESAVGAWAFGYSSVRWVTDVCSIVNIVSDGAPYDYST